MWLSVISKSISSERYLFTVGYYRLACFLFLGASLIVPTELHATFSLRSSYTKSDRSSMLLHSAEFFHSPLSRLQLSFSFSSDFTCYPYLGDFLEERTLNNRTMLGYSGSFGTGGFILKLFATGYPDHMRRELSFSPFVSYRWFSASVFYKRTDQLELTSSSGGGELSLDWAWESLKLRTRLMRDFSTRLPASEIEFSSAFEQINLGKLRVNLRGNYSRAGESYPYFSESVRDIDNRELEELFGEGYLIYTPLSGLGLTCSLSYLRSDLSYSVLEGGEIRRDYLAGISKREDNFNTCAGFDFSPVGWFRVRGHYGYEVGESDYGNDELDEIRDEAVAGMSVLLRFNEQDSIGCSFSSAVSSYDDRREPSSARDRLSQSLRVTSSISPYPFLSLEATFAMHFIHMLYLKGELVGGNRWDKSYYLSTGYRFRVWGVEFSQRIPIIANYILYDEPRELSNRNRIRRGLTLETRLERGVEWWRYLFSANVGYEEYGQLIWRGQWVERRSWAVTKLSLKATVSMGLGAFDFSSFVWYEWKEAEGSALSPMGTRQEAGLSVRYAGRLNSSVEMSFSYRRENLTTSGKVAYPSFSCEVGFRAF